MSKKPTTKGGASAPLILGKQRDEVTGRLIRQAALLLSDAEDWQAVLADELGVRRDTVRNWCTGKTIISDAMIDKLAALLQRREDELRRAREALERRRDERRQTN